ncbi:MAG: PucR family transcriptional regulator ligand-binding domain-containing protein [Synergistaceae bacterium]|jgi:purine catabolism regulator|nr:PucR family transcriptional regulator ligand-binding domain-containing protein [Synergistaceae bacterium]
MPLTVKHILEMPELKGVMLIAGESGLTHRVRSVNVMEAPDIAQWLRGGEFLLSSGYQFRDSAEDFEEFIKTIHAAGTAALGFKNRFLQEFPPGAKDFADRLGLPILGLPIELPYSDIIRIVIMKTDEVENVRFSESVLRSFSEVLTEGGGAAEVIRNLAFLLNCGVCFLGETTRHCSPANVQAQEGRARLIKSGLTGPPETLKKNPCQVRIEREEFERLRFPFSGKNFVDECMSADETILLEKYPHERLSLSHRSYGHFIFENAPHGDMWRVILEHAKVAMLLALQKEIATRQVEARYRNEFAQDLLTGNIRNHEEVINRARSFGWNLTGKLRVVVFDIDNYKARLGQPLPKGSGLHLEEVKERIYVICKNEMRFVSQNLPYLTMSDFIAFIVNTDKCQDFRTKLEQCRQVVQEKTRTCTGFTISVGVGNEKNDFFGLSESYNEARRAIELMRPSAGEGGFHLWDEMGILTIIASVSNSEEAKKFCLSRLGGLAEDESLLHTLEILVKQNWNFKAAARHLNIHYNTIHYRYEKICELTGLDLSTGEKRLEATMALELLHINPKLRENFAS